MNVEKIKETLLKLDKKNKIKFIILFGSLSKNEQNTLSDVDVAIFYDDSDANRFKFRIKAGAQLPEKVDVQIFQDLPVAVKKEVLAGKLLHSKSHSFVVEEAMKVIKEYRSFEKYHKEFLTYLEEAIA